MIGNRVRVKSSGMAPGLANARALGSTKFANALPPRLTRRANAPQYPKEGGRGRWAPLELTDALRVDFHCCVIFTCVHTQILRA